MTIGVGICIAIYLLANVAYLRVLSIPEIAASDHVGATAAERAMGPAGGTLVSTHHPGVHHRHAERLLPHQSREYTSRKLRTACFSRRFGEIHPRYSTPAFAIAAQAVWAVVLLLSGTYETLIDYSMFALWLFYGFTIFAVIRLRRLRPDLERPYRMWGYPVTPLLFVAVTAWCLGNMLVTRPGPSFAGLALIATGIPVYFFWRKKARRPQEPVVADPVSL